MPTEHKRSRVEEAPDQARMLAWRRMVLRMMTGMLGHLRIRGPAGELLEEASQPATLADDDQAPRPEGEDYSQMIERRDLEGMSPGEWDVKKEWSQDVHGDDHGRLPNTGVTSEGNLGNSSGAMSVRVGPGDADHQEGMSQ